MKRCLTYIVLLYIPLLLHSQELGSWRYHLSYGKSTQVIRGNNRIYSASEKSLLIYYPSNGEIQTLDKAKGLSETGIRTIEYNSGTNLLIIVYENANIDLLSDNFSITNIPDIKTKNISGSKQVNAIHSMGNFAYLACDFGIVKLDLMHAEIDETYIIGANGDPDVVYDVSTDSIHIYAATKEGVKKAWLTDNNLLDFQNWETVHNGLPTDTITMLYNFNDTLYCTTDTILYQRIDTNWHVLMSDTLWQNQFLGGESNLSIIQWNTVPGANQAYRLLVQQSNTEWDTIVDVPSIIAPVAVLQDSDQGWYFADVGGGLKKSKNGGTSSITVYNAPLDNQTYNLSYANGKIYLAPGALTRVYSAVQSATGFSYFDNGNWTGIDRYNTSGLDTILDMIRIAENPIDGSIWVGSSKGLFRYQNGQVTMFNNTNSPLEPVIGNEDFTIITGLAFDRDGNLWVANYGTSEPLKVRTPSGEWHSFVLPNVGSLIKEIYIDDNGNKWMPMRQTGGIFVYHEGALLESSSDDETIHLTTSAFNGNLPNEDVNTLAQDNNGEMWVGTNEGIAVFDCPSQIFDPSTGCQLARRVKATLDEYTEYLFETDVVVAIDVDGANRKWIGTSSGVWLMSESGEEELLQFDAENSPLPNDQIVDIAIEQKSGEVFIGTASSLIAYFGDATEGASDHSEIKAYPNPVRPEYTGPISITGLVDGAFVKITDISGVLIDEGPALGGKYIWNGENYNGTRAKTGIYLIHSSNPDGSEKAVTKVAFVN